MQPFESQNLTIPQTVQLALKYYQSGNLLQAEQLYKKILFKDPENADVNHLLGAMMFQKGKYETAIQLLKKAVQANPDFAEAHNNLGIALKKTGLLEKALLSFKNALSIKPNYAEAYFNLGVTLNETDRVEEALKKFRKAISIRPDYAQAHNNLGIALKKSGDLDGAIACCRKALLLNPEYIEAHNDLGNALKEAGFTTDAINCYKKAISINPGYAEAYNNLGTALKAAGLLEESVAAYQSAISIKPGFASAFFNLGNVLKAQGHLNDALQAFKTAFEKDPENQLIIEAWSDALNYNLPNAGSRSSFAKAQEELLQLETDYKGQSVISDKTVHDLYMKSHAILEYYDIDSQNFSATQIWRGIFGDYICLRHKAVFDTYNVIPEDWLICFKVLIEPRTVMELFKLMLVFNDFILPRDNTRKCMVEVRPDIPGTYKGLIYCQNLTEAKKTMEMVKKAVDSRISEKIPASIKRGCSEHVVTFPKFAEFENNGQAQMIYNRQWHRYESKTDKTFIGHINHAWCDTHNHPGLTLNDALIMQTWVTYAKQKGDASFLRISKSLP